MASQPFGIQGFHFEEKVWGQPLTLDKTEISRKGGGSIFCSRLAIIKSDPTACCVVHIVLITPSTPSTLIDYIHKTGYYWVIPRIFDKGVKAWQEGARR